MDVIIWYGCGCACVFSGVFAEYLCVILLYFVPMEKELMKYLYYHGTDDFIMGLSPIITL